jgi:hypothetical protein
MMKNMFCFSLIENNNSIIMRGVLNHNKQSKIYMTKNIVLPLILPKHMSNLTF